MRIAILNDSSPYGLLTEEERHKYQIKMGHSHSWVRNLAEALARMPGNEVHVVGMTGELPEYLHRACNGVHYHFLRSTPLALKAVTLFESNAWKMTSFLRSLSVDIVNPHTVTRSGYFAIRSGLPAVFTMHGIDLKKWLALFPRPWYEKRLLLHYHTNCRRRARDFIVVSAVLLDERNYLHPDSHFWTVENAIATDYFAAREIQQSHNFLFVGSLQPRKSQLDLLRALTYIPQARVRFIFEWAHSDYGAEMKQFVVDHGLVERVDFLGGMEAAQIAEELAQCCALVLTSYLETAPMVISEAMAVGKPVIATAVNGVPLMVADGRTGLLFQPGDVQTLVGHMRRLLDDPALAQRMGAAGRQEALRRWHPDSIARQTMKVYQEIIRT